MSERITRADIPRLAALLADAGQRLGQHTTRAGHSMPAGEAAWFASLEYQPGPRAANTDPLAHGNRWETNDDTGEVWPVPSDTTGDSATSPDAAALMHVRYRALLDWLNDNAADLRNLIAQLVPAQPNTKITPCGACGAPRPVTAKRRNDLAAADVAQAGWCKSCYRDDRYLQPIEVDRSGHRYYAAYCRWCGGFKADHGVEPPLAVLRIHHQRSRVSVAEIQKHCGHCMAKAKSRPHSSERSLLA